MLQPIFLSAISSPLLLSWEFPTSLLHFLLTLLSRAQLSVRTKRIFYLGHVFLVIIFTLLVLESVVCMKRLIWVIFCKYRNKIETFKVVFIKVKKLTKLEGRALSSTSTQKIADERFISTFSMKCTWAWRKYLMEKVLKNWTKARILSLENLEKSWQNVHC